MIDTNWNTAWNTLDHLNEQLCKEVNPKTELTTEVSKTEFGDKVDFYEGDTYIGTASTATVDAKDDFIYDVIVDPDRRGKGYGTRIMHWMLDHYPIELLNVARDNKIAQVLYKKLGFRKECNVRLDDGKIGDRMRLQAGALDAF